jgi:predicted DNA-binding transcriptional regulator AlpA
MPKEPTKMAIQIEPSQAKPIAEIEEKFLTVSDVAEMLNCSLTSIYNWSNPNGPDRIPGFPMPRALGPKRTRFMRTEVLRFMASAPCTLDRAHHFKTKQQAA